MPKDVLNALGSFGEGFISTLKSERERKQKELEFQQKMGSDRRQQKLTGAYYDALTKNMQIDNNLAEAKFGTEQRSRYDVSTDSLSPVGTLGEDLNKQFNGMFSPFEKDKRYTPKQEKQQAGIDLWEDINPNTIDPTTKKPAKLMRNKQTGEERYVENYKAPNIGGSGSGKNSKGDKLTNQYEIVAFSNLKNSGTGKEDEEYTPQMRNRDFNTVANALLTPNALDAVNKLRKGIGDYPTEEDLLIAADDLTGADRESIKSFLPYYRQVETTLAPVKTINKWLK